MGSSEILFYYSQWARFTGNDSTLLFAHSNEAIQSHILLCMLNRNRGEGIIVITVHARDLGIFKVLIVNYINNGVK